MSRVRIANGGVFNPKNLNLFGYTYNNPVNLVDPDGDSPLSAVASRVAKHGLKEGIKNYGHKVLAKRFKNHMTKAEYKKFNTEVNKIAEQLDSEIWEIALELIPVAGDLYGAGKFTKDSIKAWKRIQSLENKWANKLAHKFKGFRSDKKANKLKESFRNKGVYDTKTDANAMGQNTINMESHHKLRVSREDGWGHRSDPSNQVLLTPAEHKALHKREGY